MEKGFNSDINIKGKLYHIQTEDWGSSNPFIVSRVFCNGAVIRTIKTSYNEVLKNGPKKDAEAIQLALRQQHFKILDDLFSR